jgi:long-chain acyl-CoA synthetase
MKSVFAVILMLCVWTTTHAKQVEKVDFPEETMLGNQKLVLNGAGLRTKKKFGMNFRVYVAGLYLTAKNADANAVIASPANKVLELVFLRGIDRETLQEAWQEGFEKNCKADCESAKDAFKAFNDTMVDVKENSRLKMTFDKDGVAVDIKGGKNAKKAQVIGEAFKRALMAIFIGDNPPTPELKAALLGK